MPMVQRARAIVKATDTMQAALESGDVVALAAVMSGPEAEHVPKELSGKAQLILEEEKQRKEEVERKEEHERQKKQFVDVMPTFLKCHSTHAMRRTIADGEALGLPPEELEPLR